MQSINTIIKHPCVAPQAMLAVAAVLLLALTTAAQAAMLAHWTFDEAGGMECADASGHGYRASCATSATLGRVAGVFGNALGLSGNHNLNAPGGPDFSGIDWLSIRPRVKTAPRIVRPGPVD